MGIVQMRQCENCEKTTDNRYREKGWINFDKSVSVSISKGEYENSSFQTFFRKDVEDFCSLSCFTNFMESAK